MGYGFQGQGQFPLVAVFDDMYRPATIRSTVRVS
jgi:hypothetical protein